MQVEKKKAQVGIEYLALLAIVLIVILPIAYYAYLNIIVNGDVAQAQTAVSRIVDAANFVSAQGPGATTQVQIILPNSYDASKSFLNNTLLNIHLDVSGGKDVLGFAEQKLLGSLPASSGVYYLTVSARNGYVYISGGTGLDVNPLLVSVNTQPVNTSTTLSETIVYTNLDQAYPLTVQSTLNWPYSTGVLVSFNDPSDALFNLNPETSRNVVLNVNITPAAYGTYTGSIVANASNGDVRTVNIIIVVANTTCNICQTCPSGVTCNATNIVISTFKDSGYTIPKYAFNPASNIIVTSVDWPVNYSLNLTVQNSSGNIPGFPIVILTNSTGGFQTTIAASSLTAGSYTVIVNDSNANVQRTASFNVVNC
jgi:hypothetical protein